MRTASVHSVPLPGGRRLTLRQWEGDGLPLVLLHGMFDSSAGWHDLAQRTSRRCVAVDLPGFGGSSLPARPRIDSYADDVALTLARAGVGRCALVGHSLGGAVAAALVERLPATVSLVLLAPAGFGRIPLAELLGRRGVADVAALALPLALMNPLTVTAAYAALVGHGRPPERELLVRLRSQAMRVPQAVRAATIAIAHAGREQRRRLAFDGRAAALWGACDVLVPAGHADGVRAALPHAEVELWPGMGHHPQHERPGALAHYVESRAAPERRAQLAHAMSRLRGPRSPRRRSSDRVAA